MYSDFDDFQYCTPKCRDEHLLEDNVAKTKADIEKLKVLAAQECSLTNLEDPKEKGLLPSMGMISLDLLNFSLEGL